MAVPERPLRLWDFHAGTANLEDGGQTRIFLCLTFRNTKAIGNGPRAVDLGHVPCCRQGYKEKFTLGALRRELASDAPFVTVGSGLVDPAPASA